MEDAEGIYNVYIESAKAYVHNLTQQADELSLEYIKKEVIQNSLDLGLILVAENDNGKIIGSFKSYTSPYRTLAHIMSNTTFVTTPDYEGKKAFVVLIKEFFKTIEREYKHIYKVDGVPHGQNKTAIECYLRNGYKVVGNIEKKIFNNEDNFFDDEVIIMWTNKNFELEELKKYHKYLNSYLRKKYNY